MPADYEPADSDIITLQSEVAALRRQVAHLQRRLDDALAEAAHWQAEAERRREVWQP